MGHLLSRLLDALPFGFKDTSGIDAIWRKRQDGAARRLGTFAEARQSLDDLERAGHGPSSLKDILLRDRDLRKLGDEDPVGDPKDVHHVIPPHHLIGYAVEETLDGHALETIEALYGKWTLLRRRGKLIGAAYTSILRMETYGPIHVV